MPEIPLHGGLVAIVDDGDEWVEQFAWHPWLSGSRRTIYARHGRRRPEGGYENVVMHRLILGTDQHVDHRDGDGLNNRRSNLRLANHSQNGANAPKRLGTKSRYKGVSTHRDRWRAQIRVQRKYVHLGMFADEADAARAYDLAALEAFGEFARLNFPEG